MHFRTRYPLGAGSARPNPKKGAPDTESPSCIGLTVLRGGIETMVSDHGLGRGQTLGQGRSEFAKLPGSQALRAQRFRRAYVPPRPKLSTASLASRWLNWAPPLPLHPSRVVGMPAIIVSNAGVNRAWSSSWLGHATRHTKSHWGKRKSLNYHGHRHQGQKHTHTPPKLLVAKTSERKRHINFFHINFLCRPSSPGLSLRGQTR